MFAYPSQRLQDWLSQQWCICTGQKFDPEQSPWLLGPYGHADVIEDRYVYRIAEEEGLEVKRNSDHSGLLDSMDVLSLSQEGPQLHSEIRRFYEHTLDYEFEVWSHWCSFFRPFGGLISRLYSRRLKQLNLPLSGLDTAYGIQSQIYKLIDPSTGDVKHTVWYRHLKSTNEVIYSGVYTHCTLPSGEICLKVIFPLPRGSATVIMGVTVDEQGALVLTSKGRKVGDPGFYFLLEDAKGQHWLKYLKHFHESIRVFVDQEQVLRADHTLSLYGAKALHLHYRMNPVG